MCHEFSCECDHRLSWKDLRIHACATNTTPPPPTDCKKNLQVLNIPPSAMLCSPSSSTLLPEKLSSNISCKGSGSCTSSSLPLKETDPSPFHFRNSSKSPAEELDLSRVQVRKGSVNKSNMVFASSMAWTVRVERWSSQSEFSKWRIRWLSRSAQVTVCCLPCHDSLNYIHSEAGESRLICTQVGTPLTHLCFEIVLKWCKFSIHTVQRQKVTTSLCQTTG